MSILELKHDFERQLANPPRRFDRPRDVLAYIEDQKPSKLVKVTLDLCVMSVVEKELCWYLYLIETNDDEDFEERKDLIEGLDEEMRSKYVFRLALWKAKKQSRDHVSGSDYVPGNSYVFANVKGLHVYYGLGQGSVQAQFAVKDEADEPRNRSKRHIDSLAEA